MMNGLLLSVLILASCFAGCSNRTNPGLPLNPCESGCDTCGNELPIASFDTSQGRYPLPRYTVTLVSMNAQRTTIVGLVNYHLQIRTPFTGLFVRDLASGKTVCMPSWGYALFSDGKRLVNEYPGFQGLGIYNLSTGEMKPLISGEFVKPTLSVDEKFVFADSAFRTFRIALDGSGRVAITDSLYRPRPLDTTHLVSVEESGVKTLDLFTGTITPLTFAGVPSGVLWGVLKNYWALSPDRTKMLVEVTGGSLYQRSNAGLYLLDFSSRTGRRLLSAQSWGQPYIPTWTSNTTFTGTWFCVKDSTAMAFEYDLNGRTLRQLTFKEMKLYP